MNGGQPTAYFPKPTNQQIRAFLSPRPIKATLPPIDAWIIDKIACSQNNDEAAMWGAVHTYYSNGCPKWTTQ